MSRTDPRTYITVHDGMPDHPKIVGLSDTAFRTLIAGWCWCSRYLTDGRMPLEVWQKLGSKRGRDQLVSVALVYLNPDGKSVDFHDYLEHQRSRERVLDLRSKRSAAGAKGGKASSKPQASASPVVGDLPSKTETENREQRTENREVAEVTSESYVSNAREPEPQLSRSFPSNVVLIANRYTDKVKLSDRSKVCNVVEMALKSGYLSTKIEDALGRLADTGMAVTPDTLRIEIEGRPKSANGRASPNGYSTGEQRAMDAAAAAQQVMAARQQNHAQIGPA